MHKTIAIGPQKFTVPVELEAEVRRLLWAQLRRRPRLRLVRPGEGDPASGAALEREARR
jgi:hypothetical protein